MPKIGASIANVSTEFVPVDPDLYLCDISDVEYSVNNGRATVVVSNKIVSGEETGAENKDKVVKDRISLHKKNGDENEFGVIQLKRYAEAAIPGSSEWDEDRWAEFDTDELKGLQVQLAVVVRVYEEDLPGDRKEERKTNDIKRVLPV